MVVASRVLIISPRFSSRSFWGFKKTCEVAGFKYPTSPLGLLTVAAMLPSDWEIRFVDRNTGDLKAGDLEWADLIMTGGMLPQQRDILEVIDLAHRHGKPIVVGGADVTSSPHVYQAADFRVIGEAELVIDDLIEAWRSGAREGCFEAEKFKADVTKTPIPRFDLLNFRDYVYVGVQFSRGCPFNCEFCDIIELFGRVPRVKTTEQVLAELDRLYELGYRGHVDFVDDNLIGNKKALRQLLPALEAWQEAHGYPFAFSTEASVNLADDEELLGNLQACNFFLVYVGIESPNADILTSAQKKHNASRDLVESVRRINGSGLVVTAGFILGFDSETESTAEAILDYIEAGPLPIFMVSLLCALPKTQLTRRLQREGRLHVGHELVPDDSIWTTTGLNFETSRPRREILQDFQTVLQRGYDPAAFFGRLTRMVDLLRCPPQRTKARPREVLTFLRLIWHMTAQRGDLRWYFLRILWYCVRRNPNALGPISTLALMYAHAGLYADYVVGKIQEEVAALDAGRWVGPGTVPPAEGFAGRQALS